MSKKLRKAFKAAKESEKELMKYYKKKFLVHTIKLNTLYTKHIENIQAIDNCIPSLNSMRMIFNENIPNAMKKKKLQKSEILEYVNDKSLKLSSYDKDKFTNTDIEFVKYHLHKQIGVVINDYFKPYVKNIKNVQIKLERPSEVLNNNLVNVKKLKSSKKTRKANKHILENKIIIVKLLLTLIDGRTLDVKIEHKGFKIKLDDAYKKIAKIIKEVIPPEKRRSLESYLKEKERSLKHSLLKEKEKRLGELLTESKRSKETRDRISKLQMELYKSKMPVNMGLISPMGTSGDLREQYYGKQEEEERNVDKFNNNISAQKLEAQLSNTSSVNSGIGVNSSPFGKGLNNANENNELRKMLDGSSGSLKNSKKKLTKKKK